MRCRPSLAVGIESDRPDGRPSHVVVDGKPKVWLDFDRTVGFGATSKLDGNRWRAPFPFGADLANGLTIERADGRVFVPPLRLTSFLGRPPGPGESAGVTVRNLRLRDESIGMTLRAPGSVVRIDRVRSRWTEVAEDRWSLFGSGVRWYRDGGAEGWISRGLLRPGDPVELVGRRILGTWSEVTVELPKHGSRIRTMLAGFPVEIGRDGPALLAGWRPKGEALFEVGSFGEMVELDRPNPSGTHPLQAYRGRVTLRSFRPRASLPFRLRMVVPAALPLKPDDLVTFD